MKLEDYKWFYQASVEYINPHGIKSWIMFFMVLPISTYKYRKIIIADKNT
jgi:hypothetical protein